CVYRLRGDAVELVSLWANGDAALADGIARAALASCKEVSVYAVCVGDGDELKNFCRCISLPSEGQLEIDSILRSCAGAPSGM
ncbi:MAG: hypothetical protein RRY38_02775, partial [Oscillospiraceae bacterium]